MPLYLAETPDFKDLQAKNLENAFLEASLEFHATRLRPRSKANAR
jgi:hypothetical protein